MMASLANTRMRWISAGVAGSAAVAAFALSPTAHREAETAKAHRG